MTTHRLLLGGVVSLLAIFLLGVRVVEAGVRTGDCNGNGVADPVFALNHLFVTGSDVPNCREACNANNDDTLNLADALAILNRLFLSAPPLDPPHLACGVDPDPSLSLGCERLGCD